MNVSPYFPTATSRYETEKRSDNLEPVYFELAPYALIFRLFVVILATMYPRTVKIRSSSGTINKYVCVVEAFRENGKVKQRVVTDLGRKDVLVQMLPKFQRLLAADEALHTAELPDSVVLDTST